MKARMNNISNSGPLPFKRDSTETDFEDLILEHKYFVATDEWIPHSQRSCCYVCTRNFNPFRRRHSCRMCGEVICGKCSVHKRVNLPVVGNKVRICSGCFLSYRKNLLETTTPATSYLSSTASFSSSPSSSIGSGLSDMTKYDDEDYNILSANLLKDSNNQNVISSIDDEIINFDALPEEGTHYAIEFDAQMEESRRRVEELEDTVDRLREQRMSTILSFEQEKELDDARNLIEILQRKLKLQADEMRKVRSEQPVNEVTESSDEATLRLQKKLQKMERQLLKAGLNIAEDIPYEEAKEKVQEISRRMQEIGSSEVVCDDKVRQQELRKEYFILEQEMERYNTALMMTDEFIDQENLKEQLWSQANKLLNTQALKQLRRCIPVNISVLSEKDCLQLETPLLEAGFPKRLAQKLKRTNILELLRCDPQSIQKMHPSVIERYRQTGLSLLERRALHAVLHGPFTEWKKLRNDDLSNRKYLWYSKMYDTLKLCVRNYELHRAEQGDQQQLHHHNVVKDPSLPQSKLTCCQGEGGGGGVSARPCIVRFEAQAAQLYENDLGFPDFDAFYMPDVLRSDAEGVGEKALAEAQAHALAVLTDHRSGALKKHYGQDVRAISQALGALDEMDALRQALDVLEDRWAVQRFHKSKRMHEDASTTAGVGRHAVETVGKVVEEGVKWAACAVWSDKDESQEYQATVNKLKMHVLMICKRAAMVVTGKRDPGKDGADDRSTVEIEITEDVLEYIQRLLADVRDRVQGFSNAIQYRSLECSMDDLGNLVTEVRARNTARLIACGQLSYTPDPKRASWKERIEKAKESFVKDIACTSRNEKATNAYSTHPNNNTVLSAKSERRPIVPEHDNDGKKPPNQMLAAIKARKDRNNLRPNLLESIEASKQDPIPSPKQQHSPRRREKAATATGPPNNLLEAIRKRQEETLANSA